MASVSEVTALFKRVYGDLTNLLPQDYPLAKYIPFEQKMKIGESYSESVVLTRESGITLSASNTAFELNPAIAGVVKQTTVQAYISVLPSVLPWAIMSRTAGGPNERAFFDATRYTVKNNLSSHQCFQEIFRLYGQAPSLLGYVSYASQTYRGVAFTTGTGTLSDSGGSYAFTNGINAASKYILLAPGQFASGIWVGMEGVKVNQVNSSGTIVATGKLVAVNSELGFIQVDFTPVAASSTTSHRLCFDGMESAQDYLGVNSILANTSTLFGINTSQYSLWKASQTNLLSSKLTLVKFQSAVANLVNRGGLYGDLLVLCNPRTWATLASTEAGLRVYDSSYKQAAENGFDSVTFYTQAGKATFLPHRCVKEGDAFALHLPTWARSGSSEVSFQIPGINEDVVFPLQNQAGYGFRSFSDQYVFCHEPAKNLYMFNINDEAAA